MILQQRQELGISRKTEILCYAFAPPPVFGPLEEVRADAKEAIRSFVCGNDAVPRMSLASTHELARDLKEMDAGGVSLRVANLRLNPGIQRVRVISDGLYFPSILTHLHPRPSIVW